jgi:hypothetical protein
VSLATAITKFRTSQAALFTENASIQRPGESTFNPTTGAFSQPMTSVFTGPSLLRPATEHGPTVQIGEQAMRVNEYIFKCPVNTSIQKNDVITINSSTYDSGLVGRKYRITTVLRDGWQICRKARCEEVT